MKKHWFTTMAQNTAKATGSSSAFMAICAITLAWMVTGPLFHWSDTWQLVINTVTNIVSMLMVFLIQNTQNRESSALQLKIDELLRGSGRSERIHQSRRFERRGSWPYQGALRKDRDPCSRNGGSSPTAPCSRPYLDIS